MIKTGAPAHFLSWHRDQMEWQGRDTAKNDGNRRPRLAGIDVSR